MIRRWLAVAIACAGCGDNARRTDDPLAPVSGTRLTLQIYRYDDGTEQPATSEFYDTQLHARCSPLAWPDGALRCVPAADDAAFVDPGCTVLIGLGRTITNPTHFIVYDQHASGSRVATHVFRAGGPAAGPTQIYSFVDGVCMGPTAVPLTISRFWAVSDEVDGDSLVAFHGQTLGDDRLGLQILRSDDGLSMPSGLVDRTLGAPCTPAFRADGSAVCQPANAAVAAFYRDPLCSIPAVAADDAAPPAIAEVADASGCASYHSVGSPLSAQIYRRDASGCAAVDSGAMRMFSLGAPIELVDLERSVDQVPGHRIQRIALGGDGLHWFADRVFDTTTGADCQPRLLRDTYRCLPPNTTAAIALFDAACTTQVRVAEVASPACAPLGFATTSRPFQLHAIGAPITDPLATMSDGTCAPYTGPPGTERRALGPALDLNGFPTAVYYGARALDPPP